MTSLVLVVGFLLIIVWLIVTITWLSKNAGRESSRSESLEEGEKRTHAFQEETSRPVATGYNLIKRMRDLGR